MAVKVGSKVQLDSGEFRVARLAGKEARLIKVGVKADDASEADGTLRYRRLTTLERMLEERKAGRKQNAKVAATEEVA